jgi:plasmid maintenance system antidote protein VapI
MDAGTAVDNNRLETPDIDEISAVNLTKLTWDQPLVSSVRILLASGRIPSYALVRADNTPYEDNEIRQFTNEYDKSAGVDNAEAPSVCIRLLPDGQPDLVTDVRSYHRAYADAVYASFPSRSRAGAVMSVLFTELGWQVRTIADILDVSRPTVNKWVMTHINEPVSEQEEALLNAAANVPHTASDTDGASGRALLDVRTSDFRTKRSGLVLRKVVALPPQEIATAMRALWRVSYKSRGAKSTLEEQVCSWVLDLMLDLLLRRGMTAQNLAMCMGVTHRAVFARFERSMTVGENAPEGDGVWAPVDDLVHAVRCFIPRDIAHSENETDDSWLYADARLLKRMTVCQRLRSQGTGGDILLQVKTHEATENNQSPVVNVYALTAPVNADVAKLMKLDTCAPSAVMNVIKSAAGKSGYEPVSISSDREKLIARCDKMLESLRQRKSIPLNAALQDRDFAAAVYGVDRYWYPSVMPRSEWKNGNLFSEVLLMQATAQWNRDSDDKDGTGRPGFGSVSYHWAPAWTTQHLVHASFRDHSDQDIDVVMTDKSDGLDHALTIFLTPAIKDAIDKWLDETEQPDGYDRPASFGGKPLLWMCLNKPEIVLDMLSGPKQLGARSGNDSYLMDGN